MNNQRNQRSSTTSKATSMKRVYYDSTRRLRWIQYKDGYSPSIQDRMTECAQSIAHQWSNNNNKFNSKLLPVLCLVVCAICASMSMTSSSSYYSTSLPQSHLRGLRSFDSGPPPSVSSAEQDSQPGQATPGQPAPPQPIAGNPLEKPVAETHRQRIIDLAKVLDEQNQGLGIVQGLHDCVSDLLTEGSQSTYQHVMGCIETEKSKLTEREEFLVAELERKKAQATRPQAQSPLSPDAPPSVIDSDDDFRPAYGAGAIADIPDDMGLARPPAHGFTPGTNGAPAVPPPAVGVRRGDSDSDDDVHGAVAGEGTASRPPAPGADDEGDLDSDAPPLSVSSEDGTEEHEPEPEAAAAIITPADIFSRPIDQGLDDHLDSMPAPPTDSFPVAGSTHETPPSVTTEEGDSDDLPPPAYDPDVLGLDNLDEAPPSASSEQGIEAPATSDIFRQPFRPASDIDAAAATQLPGSLPDNDEGPLSATDPLRQFTQATDDFSHDSRQAPPSVTTQGARTQAAYDSDEHAAMDPHHRALGPPSDSDVSSLNPVRAASDAPPSATATATATHDSLDEFLALGPDSRAPPSATSVTSEGEPVHDSLDDFLNGEAQAQAQDARPAQFGDELDDSMLLPPDSPELDIANGQPPLSATTEGEPFDDDLDLDIANVDQQRATIGGEVDLDIDSLDGLAPPGSRTDSEAPQAQGGLVDDSFDELLDDSMPPPRDSPANVGPPSATTEGEPEPFDDDLDLDSFDDRAQPATQGQDIFSSPLPPAATRGSASASGTSRYTHDATVSASAAASASRPPAGKKPKKKKNKK